MNPGHELEALVAEKVMGWTRVDQKDFEARHPINIAFGIKELWVPKTPPLMHPDHPREIIPPRYSIEIEAAWTVIEKLSASGYSYTIEKGAHSDKPRVLIWPKKKISAMEIEAYLNEAEALSESAESISHAICLAALKAVGIITE